MKRVSRLLQPALAMPPLEHWDRAQPFDASNSEVLKWIAAQPELQAWLFEKLRNWRLIVFNRETGLWNGKDWHQ